MFQKKKLGLIKNKIVSHSMLISFLLIFSSVFAIIYNLENIKLNKGDEEENNLSSGMLWEIDSISIDCSSSFNWTWAVSHDWCNGYGNSTHPYIIENVTCGYANIVFSQEAHFIIRNCVFKDGDCMSGGGINLYATENGKIINNTSTGHEYGIKLDNSRNNFISGNNFDDNIECGIYLFFGSAHNVITGNNASNVMLTTNQTYGIRLRQGCWNNTISSNIFNDNDYTGISLGYYCDNNTISGNIACNKLTANQDYGIYLDQYCDYNVISGNELRKNIDGIYYRGACNNNSILGNNISENSDRGIYLVQISCGTVIANNNIHDNGRYGIDIYDEAKFTIISGNNISNVHTSDQDYGISFYGYCENNSITRNNIEGNYYYNIILENDCKYNLINDNYIKGRSVSGIRLEYNSQENTISRNSILDCREGIHLIDDCKNNNISKNNIKGYCYGIEFEDYSRNNLIFKNNITGDIYGVLYSIDNDIIENEIFNNTGSGISYSSNNRIIGNKIYNNKWGVVLYSENSVLNNNMYNNSESGIVVLSGSADNTISGNTIKHNTNQGISVKGENNDIFKNIFIENGLNAEDNGTNNQWDNGSMGNYWHDYDGVDVLEPFGIGDTPYNISGTAGAQDRYPIVFTIFSVNFLANITNVSKSEWVQFSYTGTGGDGDLSYQWNFGDGTTSTERNPIHQYLVSGTYTVSLTATDENGDFDTETKTDYISVVEADSQPTANFTANATSVSESEWVQFFYTGTGGDGELSYQWNFGDGTTSTERNPIHQYLVSGTYTVSLTVTDEDGDFDIEIKTDYIVVIADSSIEDGFDLTEFIYAVVILSGALGIVGAVIVACIYSSRRR